MVAATYDAAMIRVFADEGGYTDDPKDPGGATNWGITIADARRFWKLTASKQDVKDMPRSVAASIYRKHYADPIRYEDLPAGVDYSVLDASINSGQGRAIPWVGRATAKPVKTVTDAVAVTNAAPDKVALIQKYWAVRLSFLQGLKTWSHFGKGWGRRCANGEVAAVRMWLAFGANMKSTEARAEMDKEAARARTAARTNKTAAAGSATAGGASSTQIDWTSLAGKVALALVIAATVALVIVLVRKAVIHGYRAEAYASAGGSL